MNTEIFVVKGSWFSCDEWETWDVAAYLTEELAQEHVRLANDWMKAHQVRRGQHPNLNWWTYRNPYDPAHDQIFLDTSYTVSKVPLFQTVPLPKEGNHEHR